MRRAEWGRTKWNLVWNGDRATIRRGTLIRLIFAAGALIANFALCLGIILSFLFGGVPGALVNALLILVALRIAAGLIELVAHYARRRSRLRRMRR